MAKLLFLQDIVYEYFGVMYISACVKQQGHECDVMIESIDTNWLERIEKEKPDVIGFSILTPSLNWAVEKAAQIKAKLNVPIVFGGVHVFLNPDKTIKFDNVDIICTGEGEQSMIDLLNSIDKGAIDQNIKGLWFKTADGIKKNGPMHLDEDLDAMPFADRNIYWKYPLIEGRTTFPIMGSRGCPYTCTYCFIPSAKKVFEGQGKFIRERSAENILAEISQCIKMSNRKRQVHFVEDHFGNSRERTIAILSGLSKMKNGTLRWAGAIRVERFNKEYYVKDLAKTNHGLLGIAVECGDDDYRKNVLKRDVKNDEIIDSADLAHKYGIKFTTLNMIGLPGETYEMALRTLELNIRIKPVYANCYIYQPYPGTELQKYSAEHHYFDESVTEKLGFSWYDRYMKGDELNKMINLQRVFGLIVKFPFLKKPMLKLVDWDMKYLLDLLFGVYYLWWLWKFYRLTSAQIYESIVLWVRNKLAWDKNPASVSIGSGEAALYAEVD
jgi:anaerobic magnesium-protoporphyrin IX monomethyl ester cyclase